MSLRKSHGKFRSLVAGIYLYSEVGDFAADLICSSGTMSPKYFLRSPSPGFPIRSSGTDGPPSDLFLVPTLFSRPHSSAMDCPGNRYDHLRDLDVGWHRLLPGIPTCLFHMRLILAGAYSNDANSVKNNKNLSKRRTRLIPTRIHLSRFSRTSICGVCTMTLFR